MTPSINKTFHIVVVAALVVIFAILSWTVETRQHDFITAENTVAQKSVDSTTREISTYINDRRRLLNLLQITYLDDFIWLNSHINDVEKRADLTHKIQSILPEIIGFTIATPEGKQILPAISSFKIGKGCRYNIDEFSKGHLESVFIHSNPNPDNYHFDILTHLKLPSSEKSIVFISVKSSVLKSILKQRPPKSHAFYLVKRNRTHLIEVSAQGHKGEIKRPIEFSAAELDQIEVTQAVKGTSWNLISILNVDAATSNFDRLQTQKYEIFFLCLLAAMIVSFIFYRTDKKRLDAELYTQDTNALLEEKVKIRTKELDYRATHDSLTKLLNRSEFDRRLSDALKDVKTDSTESVLLYLDLDQFKVINDTAGHAAGDQLLVEVASLLKEQLRRGDTLARLGGDEFGIILRHCDIERAIVIANQILSSFQHYDFLWESRIFAFGVSIGVIVINEDSKEIKDIMSLVDSACYIAKDLGRNQFYLYDRDDSEFESRRNEMFRSELALSAIKNNQLELHGQKIQGLNPDKADDTLWYEVLVRLNIDNELIYPDTFIPALEKFGHIAELDEAVFKKAVAFQSENRQFKLSVNLSGLTITTPCFIDVIKNTLKKYNVSANKICFEITETAAVNNIKLVKDFITEVHELGCSFALDDFGTGMSSFSYLQNLDVDYIKLDGSFVKDIDSDKIHYAMVESINSIVLAMDKFVIAEYVENKEVQDHLKAIGVENGQGYFIHKPERLENILINK